MTIRTIAVSLEVDTFRSPTAKAAIRLAQRFGAHLIGVASAAPSPDLIGFDPTGAAANIYAAEREDIEKRLPAVEGEFRRLLPAGATADWRAFLEPPTQSLLSIARSVDLFVLGADAGEGPFARSVDIGELVLSAGRPVMTLGAGIEAVWAEKVVIGWKDTREARRAVADALPFLAEAREVVAVTVREGQSEGAQASLDDLVGWLGRHGITARSELVSATEGAAEGLQQAAAVHAADLIVTGGYGHSRTREWLFGGMTRDLLISQTTTRLMSN